MVGITLQHISVGNQWVGHLAHSQCQLYASNAVIKECLAVSLRVVIIHLWDV